MRSVKNWMPIAAILLIAITACASVGIVTPQNFDERLAYAYKTNQGIRDATTDALTGGAMSSADAEHAQKLNNEVRAILDTAAGIRQSDPAGANTNLSLALSVIAQVDTYVKGHRK